MIQHDKIWILNKSQEFALRDKDGYSPGCTEGPVICATIEELREVWHLAYNNGFTTCHLGIEPDLSAFKTYLISKGIHIL